MKPRSKKFMQIIGLCIIIILTISISLCVGEEDEKDENGNKKNGNGNGNPDNNTTNNGGPLFEFSEINHNPETPSPGETVRFIVKIESQNPIVSKWVVVCKAEDVSVCFPAEKLSETVPNSDIYEAEWYVDPQIQDKNLLYHFTATDSLDNTIESDNYPLQIN
jgi:hypothetical protein